MTIRNIVIVLFLVCTAPLFAADNVVLITIDGLRWQEAFRGIDRELAENKSASEQSEGILRDFWRETAQERAATLMPFLHGVMTRQGTVVGNRDAGSCARVSNPWFFSYPGYNEILTGVVDPGVDSNDKVPNPNQTFMERLANKPAFVGQAAAFASWDVFPYILNAERSHIHVNAWRNDRSPEGDLEITLNDLQDDIPSPWDTVRLDAFTHHFARAYMTNHAPRMVYISYGETDDFAHDGAYDQYVMAAHRTDRFIREIWQLIDTLPAYKGKTDLFVTVDHGRGGDAETWQHHASRQSLAKNEAAVQKYPEGIVGSDAVFMAAIGPDVPASGLIKPTECLTSNRIAATLLTYLGEDPKAINPAMGAPLEAFVIRGR